MALDDVQNVRAQFPSLARSRQIYMDNAGGSQVLQSVIDDITEYLSGNNVQLGASYDVSRSSSALVARGCTAAAKYINTTSDRIVFGASTTQLFRNLAQSLSDYMTPGSEIIVSLLEHEANVSPWVDLAKARGCTLKWWGAKDKLNPQLDCEVLRDLLTPETKLVACTHTSNILGTINDIEAIAKAVHEVSGALLCVDGVAYAPHRAIDVAALGVDFYAFSWYKVYGPHLAMLYASRPAQRHMRTLGHFFHGSETLENLLELSATNYELVSSIPSICDYLSSLSWENVSKHEEMMQDKLLSYLRRHNDQYTVYGEPLSDRAKRVPLVAFKVQGRRSQDIVEAIEAKSKYGCRWGSFYSDRLVAGVLGEDADDGVIRVSLVHYNTEQEIDGFVKVLDEVVTSV